MPKKTKKVEIISTTLLHVLDITHEDFLEESKPFEFEIDSGVSSSEELISKNHENQITNYFI